MTYINVLKKLEEALIEKSKAKQIPNQLDHTPWPKDELVYEEDDLIKLSTGPCCETVEVGNVSAKIMINCD